MFYRKLVMFPKRLIPRMVDALSYIIIKDIYWWQFATMRTNMRKFATVSNCTYKHAVVVEHWEPSGGICQINLKRQNRNCFNRDNLCFTPLYTERAFCFLGIWTLGIKIISTISLQGGQSFGCEHLQEYLPWLLDRL